MEELNKIKKLLPNMVGADIEIAIQIMAKQLRITSLKESHDLIMMSIEPKTIKLLKSLTKQKDK